MPLNVLTPPDDKAADTAAIKNTIAQHFSPPMANFLNKTIAKLPPGSDVKTRRLKGKLVLEIKPADGEHKDDDQGEGLLPTVSSGIDETFHASDGTYYYSTPLKLDEANSTPSTEGQPETPLTEAESKTTGGYEAESKTTGGYEAESLPIVPERRNLNPTFEAEAPATPAVSAPAPAVSAVSAPATPAVSAVSAPATPAVSAVSAPAPATPAVSAPAPAPAVSAPPPADNASSSVLANVKEIFNIRFNPLRGEALSRMYQQQPATIQKVAEDVAAAPAAAPAADVAAAPAAAAAAAAAAGAAIPVMNSLIVAMKDLNVSVKTSKGELSKAVTDAAEDLNVSVKTSKVELAKAVADAAEAISKRVDAANKPPQPPQTSKTPQPQTKESQQERMLRAIENINLQNRIGGGGCGVGLNSLGNVGLIGGLTEKSPNTVDVATKVLEAAVLGENTLTTNILNQREKLNQDVQNKSRELDLKLKTRDRKDMELALSTELADMQKEYYNATKRMKKDTTEKEKMLVKYAKELQLKDEERRVETNAAV